MRDEVRKKILTDLFASPITLVPVIGGLTAVMLSWAVGSGVMAAAGLMAAAAGIGVFFTKLIFGLDKITQQAYTQVLQQQENERNKTLDALDLLLRQDKDPRPEKCLRELRSLQKFLRDGMKENHLGGEVMDNFERLFEGCVKHIKETDDLWRASRTLTGPSKKNVVEQRERIVVELEQTTKQLSDYVQQFNTVKSKTTDSEITDSLKDLEQSLEVAKRTEQRLANLSDKGYDLKEFE